MRNLRNIHRSLIQSPQNSELTASAWDVSQAGSIIATFGPTKENALLELKRWNKWEKTWAHIASWDAAESAENYGYDRVLDLHHFSDNATNVIILAAGDIVVVREDPQSSEEKIEIVGTVDAGISAAAWSPDGELLVINTLASTLLYMTRDFENIVDLELTADDFKASNHVSVGWGKKETQFKGKKARALQDPTVPETVDEGILHELDIKTGARKTEISWRGDGAYVALNSIQDSRRVIRIYSREGALESVSEPVDYLMSALSWRPAGNLIASIQRLGRNTKVVFFEKNGLRHGEFDLRLSQAETETWAKDISLKWNVDSSVLAVCFLDRVQLWTMGNYHYYLKQEITCHSHPGPTKSQYHLEWHPEKPLTLLLYSDHHVERLVYASLISSAPTSTPDDYGLVPVIDGKTLKLTPLRIANIPPPMALHELELARNIKDVAILSIIKGNGIRQSIIAVLNEDLCSVFEYDVVSNALAAPTLTWQSSFMRTDESAYAMSLQIASRAERFFDILHNTLDGFFLTTVDVSSEATQWNVDRSFNVPEQTEVLIPQKRTISPEPHILADGPSLSSSSTVGLPRMAHVDPSSTFSVDAVVTSIDPRKGSDPASPNGNIDGLTSEHLVSIKLDENGRFFIKDKCIVKGCTSFITTSAHLIFTTKTLLKFVHLNGRSDSLDVPPDSPESDERCRSIERGAKLVTVIPTISALVLQMPRGNLETIYPRALVLAGIRESIKHKRYKQGLLACRNHRVDMNILHDYNPNQFHSHVNLFIDQVKKVEYIDLFLSQLREEDVTETMYKETLKSSDGKTQHISEQDIKTIYNSQTMDSKVNQICRAFLQAFRSRSFKYLQSTVTAYACMSPPDLSAALLHIANLRKSNSDRTDAMIEHICFLADVNKLYDHALGLYDLELTLLIAQQSQKDPREYLPFLQNIQKMSDLRRKFAIDDHLRRHPKALQHLCDLDTFEEVQTYVVKHGLYHQAMSHYKYQQEKLAQLTRLYADLLQNQGKFSDAGIAYESLRDFASASESYRQAHMWQESLANAGLASFEAERLQSLADSLSETLVETKDLHSAAVIKLDYLEDIPTAARLFCKGYHFADAIRIATLHHRLDLLESVIDPGLNEGMGTMTELLADCKSQLNAQIPRIKELRVKKAEDPFAFWDGDIPGGGDVPDDISIAPTDASTTGGSLFTRYTNRTGTVGTNATRKTSKNRRREERKRARGKKGSVYEEEYLVNSIGRLIERINSVSDEVSRLVVGLLRRRMTEQARSVEAAMLEIVDRCQKCLGEVFQSEKPQDRNDTGPGDNNIHMFEPPAREDSSLEVQDESSEPRKPPIVRDFKGLSLLGG
ncbi:uncharacterized protein KY384_006866 [Bacidia gigantensis]|uniref:uncharacterized protein n=1 Tax=Bacidia gigantensis TaxID=2732470 RepID=UPI001D04CFF8|nr:uncharacterized protein KY384_006866 [Bacidia gigantensis]KAG8527950.1 hypothetical protein KY384_006866 [Bacidia gigantensis]